MGRTASRLKHRNHIPIDPDIVEAALLRTTRQADDKKTRSNEGKKERFHIASSCGYHNQDVKLRKSLFFDRIKIGY